MNLFLTQKGKAGLPPITGWIDPSADGSKLKKLWANSAASFSRTSVASIAFVGSCNFERLALVLPPFSKLVFERASEKASLSCSVSSFQAFFPQARRIFLTVLAHVPVRM